MSRVSNTLFLLSLTLGIVAAQAVTITVAPTLPTAEPQWINTASFTSAVLNSTNVYRTQQNASDLTWNSTLAEFADNYLTSSNCEFKHSGGPYGENLALGYSNVTASIEAWGEERRLYDFSRPGFSEATGHFTQLVWKATSTVGCGRRLCVDQGGSGINGWYLVCEYWPRGNVIGAFDVQVGGSSRSFGAQLQPNLMAAAFVGLFAASILVG
jgi:hypothetical protein